MLATFVIGLREGLEAALIVGIIAAFLKRNGRSLVGMWIGVVAALALSLAVGITLKIVESSLPQRAQEGLESVIGVVAIIFVTGMIMWMRTNSRGMKRELEAAASSALEGGTTRALAVMAFLAVLKEGFETAVFLLATFQAAGNVGTAATGAILGVLVAVVLGYGIYRGGVRLNLSKFFTYTGIFLVLVAAGLVVTALRTAHEAGWLNVGQQETFDLSALAAGGTVRGALLTGVLGIPARPRLVEVFGWFAYLVPMCLYLYLPARWRPSPRRSVLLARVGAGAALAVGVVLAVAVPPSGLDAPHQAPTNTSGTVRLDGSTLHTPSGDVKLADGATEEHAGVTATRRDADAAETTQRLSSPLDALAVASLNGGRLPVGLDARSAPGPYTATVTTVPRTSAWIVDGTLLDATSTPRRVLKLSGGGLTVPRTLTVPDGAEIPGLGSTATPASSWSVRPTYVSDVAGQVRSQTDRQANHSFWGRFVPSVLVLIALALLVLAERTRRRIPRRTTPTTAPDSSAAVS